MAKHYIGVTGNLHKGKRTAFTAPDSVIGAIIGDIVGSRFEFSMVKPNDPSKFELFREDCEFTDDTALTIALYNAALDLGEKGMLYDAPEYFMVNIKGMYKAYPKLTWGSRFTKWAMSDSTRPLDSYGNGSAMRVGFVGLYKDPDYHSIGLSLARMSAMTTHYSTEGIKGAECVAKCILMDDTKEAIRDMASCYYSSLKDPTFTVEYLHKHYRYNELCKFTVPQAIECFLESENFEDAIRKAIYIGGDSDTMAAITGSIAGSYYGIPDDLKAQIVRYLPRKFLQILTW